MISHIFNCARASDKMGADLRPSQVEAHDALQSWSHSARIGYSRSSRQRTMALGQPAQQRVTGVATDCVPTVNRQGESLSVVDRDMKGLWVNV